MQKLKNTRRKHKTTTDKNRTTTEQLEGKHKHNRNTGFPAHEPPRIICAIYSRRFVGWKSCFSVLFVFLRVFIYLFMFFNVSLCFSFFFFSFFFFFKRFRLVFLSFCIYNRNNTYKKQDKNKNNSKENIKTTEQQ